MVATAKLLIATTLYVITASKYNDIYYNYLLFLYLPICMKCFYTIREYSCPILIHPLPYQASTVFNLRDEYTLGIIIRNNNGMSGIKPIFCIIL